MYKVIGTKEGYDRRIEDVTAPFEGPLAIIDAKGEHLETLNHEELSILVPVSGSEVSRRGAEIAIALARAGTKRLRVMYVSTTRDRSARRNSSVSHQREEAILKDVCQFASRYDVDATTVLRADAAPEQAILQEIKRSRADLVVMGVDRIKGDRRDLGSIAAAVLNKSKGSGVLSSGGEVKAKGG